MSRHICHTCDVLKEIYWLKASRFVLAARSAPAFTTGRSASEEEVQALKDEALGALRVLLRHVHSCYGFNLENAA